MSLGYSPKLPLSLQSGIGYTLNKTIPEMIKQNVKMLLLTSPGERLMDNNFGVGLKNYLFEQNVFDTREDLKARIRQQIGEYMPFLEITEITVDENDNHEVYVSLGYNITSLQTGDRIIIINRNTGKLVELV
jgi:hypothetical protein